MQMQSRSAPFHIEIIQIPDVTDLRGIEPGNTKIDFRLKYIR